jgi:hypothetical protein
MKFFKSIGDFFKLIGNAFVWQPLRGGNGVTQPDELAKFLITWCGIWMVFHEGMNEGVQFTDLQFGTVFAAVVAVAGLQMYFKKNDK